MTGADSPAYQTLRYGTFQYTLDVPDGSYIVKLKFMEPAFGSPGSRVFDVAVNGNIVLSNVDVAAEAGGVRVAYDQQFPVVVSNGEVVLNFISRVNYALVCAIEIVPGE